MATQHSVYTVEIRTRSGEVVAAGSGRSGWQATATRLAARAGIAGRNDALVNTYFPTRAGAPWGTHHVQWGHTPRGAGGGLRLGNTYVVNVREG